MSSLILAALLSSPALAAEPPAVSSAALAASTMTVSSIYTGDRVRDPFTPASGGGARRGGPATDADKIPDANEPPDIHALSLRGIMKDRGSDYALFGSETGESFLLRGGRLYNGRGKPVPGITGRIRPKQKSVELVTPEKDVQVYRLGETEEK